MLYVVGGVSVEEGSHSSLELLRTETLDGFTRSEFNVTALFEVRNKF